MGSQTLVLEWQCLLDKLKTAPVQDQQEIWNEIKDHEYHMESKGYKINSNSIIDPQGETVWERSQ